MQKTKLIIYDEVNCKFEGLAPEIRRELVKRNEVFNPANRYIPSVRMGRWSGCENFFSMGGKTYINLLPDIIDYIIEKNYEIELEDRRTYNRDFTFDHIDKNIVSNINWPDGKSVILRDHQVEAVNQFFDNQQGIEVLPTASGKTLIAAILSMNTEKYGRSLIIVPNKDLITQTEVYYKMLGLDVGVYYGERKEFFTKHVISTWQSLGKLKNSPIDIGLEEPVTFQKFVDGVVAVIIDECHGIKSPILFKLLTEELAHISIRWAMSGTLPKEQHEIIKLTCAVGSQFHRIYTPDLQDLGILSKCDVYVKQLIDTRVYSTYQSEYEYLISDSKRLAYVANMIAEKGKEGNVLVLVGRKKTGKELEKLIPDSVFVSGATKSKDRKEQYDEVKTSNSKVIIATISIAAVGLDIPRLNSLFLVESGKSFIQTTQAIGRVLRIAADKNYAQVYDICSTCKYSKRHLAIRKKWYKESQFPIHIEKVTWEL
jgi:superfamily II DNA or RNA helicase